MNPITNTTKAAFRRTVLPLSCGLAAILCVNARIGAVDYTYSANGTINWSVVPWTPSGTPGVSDTVAITSSTTGSTMSINTAVSLDGFTKNGPEALFLNATGASRTFAVGNRFEAAEGTLTLRNQNSSNILTVTAGNLTIGSGATLAIGLAASANGRPAFTVDSSSTNLVAGTILVNGYNATSQVPEPALQFGHIVLDNGSLNISTGSAGNRTSNTATVSSLSSNGIGTRLVTTSDSDGVLLSTLAISGLNSGATDFAGLINNNVAVVKNGSGTQIFSGANTYAGSTRIEDGILQLGNGGTTGSLSTSSAITTNGTLVVNRSDAATQGTHFATAISGTGGLTQNGSGTLTLSAGNTYTGATTINSGTLLLGANDVLADSSSVLVNSGGVFDTFTRSDTISTLAINGGTMLVQSGTVTVSGTSSFVGGGSLVFSGAQTGRINAEGATTFGDFDFHYDRAGDQSDSRGLVLYADATVLDGSTVTFSNNSTGVGRIEMPTNRIFDVGSGATMDVDWVVDIFGGGTRSLTKTGAGTMALNGNNTYNGATTVNGGTLVLSGSNAYTGGTTIGAGTLTIGNANALGPSGTISFGGGTLQYGSGIDTDFSARFSSAASQVFTIDTNENDVEFASILGSTGGTLTKNGSGTLTLNAANTYTGATTVNGGVLEAANANALGTNAGVTVNGGSLLVSADGAIDGKNLTLGSANTLVASLAFSSSYNGTAGTLTLTEDSIIDLGGDPAGVILRFSDIVGLADHTLSIYNWSGTTLWGGTDRDNIDQIYVTADLNAPGREGQLANISFYSGFGTGFLGDGFQLTGSGFSDRQVIPVPEPETWATALLLVVGLGLYARRQSRRRMIR